MSDRSHPAYPPDRAVWRVAEVAGNERLARDTYRLRFRCPEMAARFLPGQFLMMRLADGADPLLGRPLALYDVVPDAAGRPEHVEIVYLAKGKFTRRLARCRTGDRLEVWGPLGNGFPPDPCGQLILVAGGIGQTPLLALAKQRLGVQRYGDRPQEAPRAARAVLCYGVRTAELLAGVEHFTAAGVEVHVATEDGSQGHRGLVTEVLGRVVADAGPDPLMVCCGPEPMLAAAAAAARRAGVRCWVSLETPMACGLGICFSCVAKVRDPQADQGWDYKRTCVEGPVFDARDVLWDQSPTSGPRGPDAS